MSLSLSRPWRVRPALPLGGGARCATGANSTEDQVAAGLRAPSRAEFGRGGRVRAGTWPVCSSNDPTAARGGRGASGALRAARRRKRVAPTFICRPSDRRGSGNTRSRNMRSRCRCSMCPAIHINSRSWLRSSSTHEPSDPPLRVVYSHTFRLARPSRGPATSGPGRSRRPSGDGRRTGPPVNVRYGRTLLLGGDLPADRGGSLSLAARACATRATALAANARGTDTPKITLVLSPAGLVS